MRPEYQARESHSSAARRDENADADQIHHHDRRRDLERERRHEDARGHARITHTSTAAPFWRIDASMAVIARVMRATAMVVARELYVEAARARGASSLRLVIRHIMPNSLGPVIVQASILMGFAILLEAALSFIGLGVRPPDPSLGLMLSNGRDFMGQAPWIVIAPGLAIMGLVLGFNLVGDGLRDWLDPRGRARIR